MASHIPLRTLRVDAVLADTDPPIRRQLELASDLTLAQLHSVLQAAFEWNNSHLHEFAQGERRWDDESTESTDSVALGQLMTAVGDELEYLYDLGDDWLHILTVIEVLPREPNAAGAKLISAEEAAPPDDSGGIPGYYDLLNALAHPEDPSHADLIEWAREMSFDPNRVNVAGIARRVQLAVIRTARPPKR